MTSRFLPQINCNVEYMFTGVVRAHHTDDIRFIENTEPIFPQEMLRSRISKHILLLSKIFTSLFWSIICSFSCINNRFFEKQKFFLKPFLLFLLCGQQILVRSGLIHQSGSKAGHQGRWAETEVNPGMRDHHCHLFSNTNKLETKYHKRRETQSWEIGQP